MLFYDEDSFFGSGYTEVLTVGELYNELDEKDSKILDKLVDKYNKIQNEKEENRITKKQQNVIDMICQNLDMKEPKLNNKKEAREFISKYMEQSKKAHKETER